MNYKQQEHNKGNPVTSLLILLTDDDPLLPPGGVFNG